MHKTKITKIKMSTGEKIFSVINYIFLALVAAACLYPMLYRLVILLLLVLSVYHLDSISYTLRTLKSISVK